MRFFFLFFLAIAIKSTNTPYQKKYPSIGKVGYHCEYLGTVPRKIPQVNNEQKLAANRYPTYGQNKNPTNEEKNLILSENSMLVTNTISSTGTYSAIDQDGVLYMNTEPVKYSNGTNRKLYKHTSAIGMYYGNPTDTEPAITKKITYVPRRYGFLPTGLYAPAGEVIKIRVSESDLTKMGTLHIEIGQIFQNGKANAITAAKSFVRMPIISNLFQLTSKTATLTRENGDYIFYVGSFLGGPIYVNVPTGLISTFSVTISGAIRMPHFILGYTMPEEFSDNMKSTAPCCELEVWQRGIIHSGARSKLTVSSYDDFYKAAIYWEKVTSVSNQFPPRSNTNLGIGMIYDPYVAAGGAVAYPGQSTTNCPAGWFGVVLNYNNIVVQKQDSWGPHHEYNHHFQKDWGLSGDVEVSNNAVTLVSYSFFTKISQSRTLSAEPSGYDNWAKYTSATFALNNIINNNRGNNLLLHSCLLHCFGQYVFIEAAQLKGGQNNDAYYKAYTKVTELDMTYFFKTLYKLSISDAAINSFNGKNYKKFVPIASKFQVGVGYLVKGKRNKMQTMSPFLISPVADFTMNFNQYLVIPKDFTFQVKSVTQPEHGSVKKTADNIYVYSPDEQELFSGVMTFTIGLAKKDDPNFIVDDIEMYVNLQQSYSLREKNSNSKQMKLDRRTYTWPDGKMPIDPVQAFTSNYAGSTGFVDEINSNTNENCNSELWPTLMKNTMCELRGKTISNPATLRFALRGRLHCALFLSLDEGKTYELAANLTNPSMDVNFHPELKTSMKDITLTKRQYIYFKLILNQADMPAGAGVRTPFAGLGIGIVQPDGSANINYMANSLPTSYQADPEFTSENVFPRTYTQTFNYEYAKFRGTLLESNYYPWTFDVAEGTYSIENLFDSNDSNFIHNNKENPIDESNPFMILVDIGETLSVNKFIIYGVAGTQYQYQPKTFLLYVGTDKDNLELVANVTNAARTNSNIIVTFSETKAVRYYKFIVTETYAFANNYIAYRFAQFRLEFDGINVALDDDRITLYNSWSQVQKFCTFGHLYTGQGTADSKAILEFKFTGKQYGINAFVSKEFDGFDLYLDNEFVKRINLNGDDDAVVPGLYISPTIRNTQHTVRAESHSRFNIDSFILLSDDATVVPPVNETGDGSDGIEDESAIYDEDDDTIDTATGDNSEKSDTTQSGGNGENGEDGNNDSKKKPLSTGAIVGIVVAIVAVIAIAVVVTVIVIRKKKDDSPKLLTSNASLPGLEI